jgi:pheromone shutdown protein TraB
MLIIYRGGRLHKVLMHYLVYSGSDSALGLLLALANNTGIVSGGTLVHLLVLRLLLLRMQGFSA